MKAEEKKEIEETIGCKIDDPAIITKIAKEVVRLQKLAEEEVKGRTFTWSPSNKNTNAVVMHNGQSLYLCYNATKYNAAAFKYQDDWYVNFAGWVFTAKDIEGFARFLQEASDFANKKRDVET